MVKDFGKECFGFKDGMIRGKVVDPAAIEDWASGAPSGEMGSGSDTVARGHNLRGWVEKAATRLNTRNATDTSSRLDKANYEKNFRRCDTVNQASAVVDYAFQLVESAKKNPKLELARYFKDDVEALSRISDIMANDPRLKDSSQYECVKSLARIDGKGRLLEVVKLKATLTEVVEELQSGPEPEVEEKVERRQELADPARRK
jgi:hypothetical protein